MLAKSFLQRHNLAVPKPPKPRKPKARAAKFSIAEWYGTPLTALTGDERRALGNRQAITWREREPLRCPFKPGTNCSKESGVCSLRLYTEDLETKLVTATDDVLRTACPTRFEENNAIYEWVGETVLGSKNPLVINQVPFLDPPTLEDGSKLSDREVGKIDNILLRPDSDPLDWCALEIQAVYFSGRAMENEFKLLREHAGDALPFPVMSHRPDNRSSGPKRLMPQLQTKVPTLRRWGKKMAVVVDRGFFNSLGMASVRVEPHISNCDVAWFVVEYAEGENGLFSLKPHKYYFTTLENSIEALTAGIPASLDIFEGRILEKLNRPMRPRKITPDEQLIH